MCARSGGHGGSRIKPRGNCENQACGRQRLRAGRAFRELRLRAGRQRYQRDGGERGLLGNCGGGCGAYGNQNIVVVDQRPIDCGRKESRRPHQQRVDLRRRRRRSASAPLGLLRAVLVLTLNATSIYQLIVASGGGSVSRRDTPTAPMANTIAENWATGDRGGWVSPGVGGVSSPKTGRLVTGAVGSAQGEGGTGGSRGRTTHASCTRRARLRCR